MIRVREGDEDQEDGTEIQIEDGIVKAEMRC